MFDLLVMIQPFSFKHQFCFSKFSTYRADLIRASFTHMSLYVYTCYNSTRGKNNILIRYNLISVTNFISFYYLPFTISSVLYYFSSTDLRQCWASAHMAAASACSSFDGCCLPCLRSSAHIDKESSHRPWDSETWLWLFVDLNLSVIDWLWLIWTLEWHGWCGAHGALCEMIIRKAHGFYDVMLLVTGATYEL